jgi:hypothetical protein
MKSEAESWCVHTRIGTCVLVGLLVFFFHLPFAQNNLFFDDAADYVRASDSAFLSTWLNTNSASPIQLFHLRQEQSFRSHPWDYLYIANDNMALRHFHVPVSFYALHFVRDFSTSAQPERLLISSVSSLTCALIVLVLVNFSVPFPLAALLALLAGVQSRYIEVSVDPTPHAWYMLFALCFLFFFIRYLLTNRNRELYFATVAFALTFATLEFSVELIASVPLALSLIALFVKSPLPSWQAVRNPARKAVALFLLMTLLLWPGGWLRGGFFECYGVLAATVVFKNHTAFGGKLTAGVIYQTLFAGHAILLLATVFCVVGILILLLRRSLSIPTIVFASYSLVTFGLGMADHFRLSTYISEFLLFLIATAGLVFVDVEQAFFHRAFSRRVFLSVFALAVVVGCFSECRHREDAMEFRPWLTPILSGIREKVPAGETLLVTDDWEALCLYLPQYRFEPTKAKNSAEPRSELRATKIRYYLFDGTVPAHTVSSPLAVYSTYPGRTEVLWKVAEEHSTR